MPLYRDLFKVRYRLSEMHKSARTGGTLVASYKYTRSNSNRRATNNADIELSGVTEDTTLYVRYTRYGTTYYASFKVSDAIDNDGVSLTLE